MTSSWLEQLTILFLHVSLLLYAQIMICAYKFTIQWGKISPCSDRPTYRPFSKQGVDPDHKAGRPLVLAGQANCKRIIARVQLDSSDSDRSGRHGIAISMDGKGRWMDNVFVEPAVANDQIRGNLSQGLRHPWPKPGPPSADI